jgi:hypothetical protein
MDEAAKKKAMGWIILALNEPGELLAVLRDIFERADIMALYGNQSYMHNNKLDLIRTVQILAGKDLYVDNQLMKNYT